MTKTTRVLTRESWYIGVVLWGAWWICASLINGEEDKVAFGSLMAIVWFPFVCDKSQVVRPLDE